MFALRSTVVLGAWLASACATTPPPPPVPAVAASPAPKRRLRVSAELGEIDQAATTKTVEQIQPALMKCYTDGLARLEYLAGDMKFFMRVKADGHLRWVFFEQTTLGDWQAEACMLGVLTSTQWPLPEDGEAEVHQTMGFDAPPGVHTPVDWSADRIVAAISEKNDEALACKTHGAGKFLITAYIADEQGVGRVLAAGAAPPNGASAPDVDCVVGVARSMKVPSPGDNPAKVSFFL